MFQVDLWLRALGLDCYAQVFVGNDIDSEALALVTDDDLKELGVRSLGHRKKLMAAIAELKRPRPPTSPPVHVDMGERRTVTVLFCDITAFTRLSGDRDPEEIHGLLNRYFELVDGVVKLYGGHVDKHIGDAVMAVFGAPVAHTNDPERAVRTAFAVHRGVAAMDPPLDVHIGIASGPVVASRTGSQTHDEYTITGPPVNLAARLQDMAGPGQTLVSEAVHQAVISWVDASAIDNVSLKGLDEQVRVWQLEGLHSEADVARKTRFVGRGVELGRVRTLLGTCRDDQRGHVLHLRGEAGIGKSRLTEEVRLAAHDDGYACHSALILDFGDGKGQSAITDLTCSLLDLGRSSTAGERLSAARRALETGAIEVQRDVSLFELLGLSQPSPQRTRYDAMSHPLRAQGKRETLAELVALRARTRPQLIIIEDVHWADRELIACIHHLATSITRAPVLLIVTSRLKGEPLHELERDAAIPLTTTELMPLRPQEALALATSFSTVSSRYAQSCVERAGGNPLFLEQLLQSAESLPAESLPDSLQSIILARIDNLEPHDKSALQTASVMGQRFSMAALRYLLGESEYTCKSLIEHQLIRPVGDGEYLFAHALVLEGVYSSLLRSRRKSLHRQAARWFGERNPILRAEHLDRAEDPGAPHAYLEAARQQVFEYRFERALLLVERSLELARTSDPSTEYVATCVQGEILRKLAALEPSLKSFERALLLARNDIERCRAWLGMAASMRIVDRTDDALALLAKAEGVVRAHDLLSEQASIHYQRGNLLFTRGDINGCLLEHERARDLARRVGSARLEAKALSGVGDAAYLRGRMLTAHSLFDRCMELCRRHGFGSIEVANLPMRGLTRYYQNDVSGGLRDGQEAAETAALVGHKRAECIARSGILGLILTEMGRLSEAQEELETALDLASTLGALRFEALALAFIGRIAGLRGKRQEACVLLQQSLEIYLDIGMVFMGPWVLGLLASSTDDPDERSQAMHTAEALLANGAPSHNHLNYNRLAIELSLAGGDADGAERYAAALESHTAAEPLPWALFMASRGRALARFVRGERSAGLALSLQRLYDEGRSVGLHLAAEALHTALTAVDLDHGNTDSR